MLLFGIGHKARNGKDSMGEYLSTKYGFKVYHYADTLKREAEEAGWNPEDKNENALTVLKRTKYEPLLEYSMSMPHLLWTRAEQVTFLQWYGTEFRRYQDPDYWVKATFAQIEKDFPSARFYEGARVAICDMRFVNELLAVKARDGYTFDVRRISELHITGDRDYFRAHPTNEFERKQMPEGTASFTVSRPYFDPDRDPNHPSEVELDGIPHDFSLTAGNLPQLYQQTDNIMKYLKQVGVYNE